MKKTILSILFIIIAACLFFLPVIKDGKLPVPSDDLVGLYHPWRDYYESVYPRGFPFKNFLITDPVRQQIPWRKIVAENLKNFIIPSYNPYNFSGSSLAGNIQSASFYPFNILFLIFSFSFAWTILVILQPVLSFLFMYLYLRNLHKSHTASLLSGLAFAYGGFSVVWMTWGTIGHVALWVPLGLLCIDRIKESKNSKNLFCWSLGFCIAAIMMILAGHLQIALYGITLLLAYYTWHIITLSDQKRKRSMATTLIFSLVVIFIVTSFQWIPVLHVFYTSNRSIDQSLWQKAGWFIPVIHLLQLLVPDYFGNPATMNYWGTWNYSEMILYIGVLPLFFSFISIIFCRKQISFWLWIILCSLLFAIDSPLSRLSFVFHIPVLSVLQPTRLTFLSFIGLIIISSYGIDYVLNHGIKKLKYPYFLFFGLYIGIILITLLESKISGQAMQTNYAVAKRNLIYPAFLAFITMILSYVLTIKKSSIIRYLVLLTMLILCLFDFVRFGWKFTPFISSDLFFPQTKAVSYLVNNQKSTEPSRYISLDKRLLPPNTGSFYGLESIDGYDSFVEIRYEEFVAAAARGKPDITRPYGFDRIITLENYNPKLLQLLNVKYIVSLQTLDKPDVRLVFTEGQTKIYENIHFLPRFRFVTHIINVRSKQDSLNVLFSDNFQASQSAVVENFDKDIRTLTGKGLVSVTMNKSNHITLKTKAEDESFMVLSIPFDSSWDVYIDKQKIKNIYRTNYDFMGIIIPAGNHDTDLLYNICKI